MEIYESPKMKFESVTLFEKIANPCWARKTLHMDVPGTDDDIIITLRQSINPSGEPNNGCGDLVIDCIKTEITGKSMPLPGYFDSNESKNYANTQLPCISGS